MPWDATSQSCSARAWRRASSLEKHRLEHSSCGDSRPRLSGRAKLDSHLGGRVTAAGNDFGAVKAVRRDLVIRSQGLRGSDPGVVWRMETSLPHWKPGPRITKSINS